MRISNHSARSCIVRSVFILAALVAVPAETLAEAGDLHFGLIAGPAGSEVDNGDYRFDIFLGYSLTRRFELGLRWDHMSAVLNQEFDALLVSGSFSLRPGKRSVPYLLVGIGRAETELLPLLGVSESDGSLAYQIGVGGCFYPGRSKRLGLRLELSDMWEDTFERNSTHRTLLGGVSWRFGSERG